MTKPLTPEQKQFLEGLLGMRPQDKTPLNGRKLGKIKSQFQDFLRRRNEAEQAVDALEIAHGPTPAKVLWQDFVTACKLVEVGANTGDETVFKAADDRLRGIRKDAEAALKDLEAKAKEFAKAGEVFENAAAAIDRAPPGKQAALGRTLVDRCAKWLAEHQDAVVPRVNAAMEKAQAIGNVSLTSKQSLVFSTHMANETTDLCRIVESTADADQLTDEDRAGVGAMLTRLDTALQNARVSGNVVAVNQLQVAIGRLKRTQLRVDPPTLDDPAPAPLPASGPARVLNALIKDLTEDEKVERTHLKCGSLITHAKDEMARVLSAVSAAKTDRTAILAGLPQAVADTLADDIALIDDCLAAAEASMALAKVQIGKADENMAAAADETAPATERTDSVDAASGHCDRALTDLSFADKSLGRAEGGIVFVGNKKGAYDSIPKRIGEIDPEQVAAVKANIAVLPDCDTVYAKDAEHRELLKHLVIVSADAGRSRSLVKGITDDVSYERQVQALMTTPKLGTQLVTQLMNQCQAVVNDCQRYIGDPTTYLGTIADPALKAKFSQIIDLSKTDAARFTVPVVVRRQEDANRTLMSVGVAVVGGGPIGLLAAVEARMAGASQVNVYEGRSDPYSRMNVLEIGESVKRLAAAGIYDQVVTDPDHPVAAVKDIESALEQRCSALGVKLQRDKFLVDVTRNDKGVVQLTFKGDPTPVTCDFLIVATGGSVAGAQKHANNVVLGDKLGVVFQKSAVKDYAAVGLFKTDAAEVEKNNALGWQYDFNTAETQYVVSQLTEEEFNDFAENPRKLVERIQLTRKGVTQTMVPSATDPGRNVKSIGDSVVDDNKKDKGKETEDDAADAVEGDGDSFSSDADGVAPGDGDALPQKQTPLEQEIDSVWTRLLADFNGIDNFYGKDKAKDAASIAKCKAGALGQLRRTVAGRSKDGNAGKVSPAEVEKSLMAFLLAEFGVSRFPIELQQANGFTGADGGAVLVGDSAATPHPSTAKGFNTGVAEMGAMHDLIRDLQSTGGDEGKRKDAMQAYDFEVKRRTDMMIDAALDKLQSETAERVRRTYYKRIALEMRKWGGGSVWGQSWVVKLEAHAKGMRIPQTEAANDRDWSRRESAVQSIRALLTKVETGYGQIKARNDVLLQGRELPVTDALPDELKKVLTDIVA